MSDELALRKDAERASHAKRLLEDDLLKEAFEAYELALTNAWKDSPESATEAREHAYYAIRALSRVREFLERVIANGVLSKAELDQIVGR